MVTHGEDNTMSLYATPEEHAANPPSTWRVVKIARDVTGGWALTDKAGIARFERFQTKTAATLALTTGRSFAVQLWLKERRWYAGEKVEGWKPYVRPASRVCPVHGAYPAGPGFCCPALPPSPAGGAK